MTDYIMTARAISNGAFTDDAAENVTFIAMPDAAPAPFTPADASPSADAWLQQLIDDTPKQTDGTGVERGDVLIFIHGYNNDISVVIERHRILKRDLPAHGFVGTIVSFDWPCGDTALAYFPDRVKAKKTAFALVSDGIRRLAQGQVRFDCDLNVHLLAHSTGAYVVQEAFDDADDRPAIQAANWTVSQIAFISADLAARSLVAGDSETESIFGHCVRLTNYANAFDQVLQISNVKRAGIEPRVGRVGLPDAAPTTAVNVDCSSYYRQVASKRATGAAAIAASHSWQFGDPVFTEDLAQTLNGDLDRSAISTRVRGESANRFILFPPAGA